MLLDITVQGKHFSNRPYLGTYLVSLTIRNTENWIGTFIYYSYLLAIYVEFVYYNEQISYLNVEIPEVK